MTIPRDTLTAGRAGPHEMSESAPIAYRFERFTAEPRTGRLLRDGEAVAIEPKVFLMLLFLLENRHRLVEKRELLEVVWHDVVVTENALTRAVARLRKILGDDPRAPRFVATVHSRGYRFLAEVERIQDSGAARDDSAVSAVAPASPESAAATAAAADVEPPKRGAARRARWPLAATGAGLVLLAAVAWQRFSGPPSPEVPASATASATALDPRRIAALPMVDLSGGGGDPYFADGLTEQMISTLSRIDGLQVLPRTTVMAYKDTDRRIAEIGRELGAGSVLEGSVRRSAEQLRITVQLVDVAREQTLWSMELDRPLRDVFKVQSEVAVRVADALQSSIEPAMLRRIERGPTRVIGAWDHYLRGRQFHRRKTRAGLISAVEHYRRALELDPEFALALAQIASAHAFQALTMDLPPGWPEAAIDAAERAIELDPEVPEAYRALAGIAYYHDHFQRAYDFAMKALELDPDSDSAVYNASSFAQALGRLDEAVLLLLRTDGFKRSHRGILAINLWEIGFEPQARELAGQVLEEEPMAIYLNLHIARREMLAGDLAAARDRLERLGQAYPLWSGVFYLLGRIEARAGRLDAAREHFEKALAVAGAVDYPDAEIRLAWIYWQRGERADAGPILERVAAQARRGIEQGSDGWVLRWRLAVIEAVRGDHDEAVRWLEEAVDLGYYSSHFEQSDPIFAPLSDDPRFQRQLERMREKVEAMRRNLMRELGPDLSGLRLDPGA